MEVLYKSTTFTCFMWCAENPSASDAVKTSLSTITESVAGEARQVSELTTVSMLPSQPTEPWLSGAFAFVSTLL